VQCQLDCQTQVYQDYEQRMVEQCDTECETTGGAIFCDGQFLNVTNIEDCAAELSAEIQIDVDLDIAADVDINPPKVNPPKDDDGDSIFNCAVSPASKGNLGDNVAWSLLGGLGALVALRRRTRSC
jgi:MYXO-CTERM domain-containing protein